MRKNRIGFICLLATLLVVFVAGCGQETVTIPAVVSVTPAQGAAGVAVNTAVTATFSVAMNPATIDSTTFTVAGPGGAAVAGTVAYAGLIATFTPTAVLAYGTTYTATITKGASNLGGAGLIDGYVWAFTTAAPSIPAVVSVTPLQGTANVAVNAAITATFSQAISAASISATTFTVAAPGGVAVAGTATLSSNGLVATFAGALAYNTTYTATVTTGVTSTGGAPLSANYVWTFTTITPPPAVVSTTPRNTATVVPIAQVLTVAFNEAMNCATLTSPATAFTVTGPGTTPVAGTASCSGAVATFTPGSPLAYNTVYTAIISTGAEDLALTPLVSAYVWTFSTVHAPTPRPTVTHTVPINLAPGVPINRALSATFSEAMDPATINSATFMLNVTGGAAVSGAVTYVTAGSVATFTPSVSLLPSTQYTATITMGATGVSGLEGATLAQNYVWNFTTGTLPLTMAPTVTSTIPADLATDVALNQAISATFSEPMNPATIISANFTLTGPGSTSVSGLVAYAAIGNTLTFTPTANLAPSTAFTATITTGVKDLAGNALAVDYVWTFTTGATLVTTPPELVSTVPANAAIDVALNQAVSATFSAAMNPLTLTTATFQLTGPDGTLIPAAITYDTINFIATLTPANPLTAGDIYTATVTDGATDLAGNPLGSSGAPNPWYFTTGTAVVVPPIVLGPTISLFGGFAGTAGLTNTGLLTVIHGDSGSTATGFSSYTGFHDDTVLVAGLPVCVYTETPANAGLVTGKIYSPLVVPPAGVCPGEGTASTIATAGTALAEATTAYTTLQGLPSTGVLAAELGNTTIAPGVYKNSSSVGITTGPVTLDAMGDPNAYWIFQIGSTLTVGTAATPASVILINGAQASNIFWAVGTNVPHLNQSGGGTFQGTLIAYGSAGIAVSTVGSTNTTTINGRLISLNASTTLVDTVINVP